MQRHLERRERRKRKVERRGEEEVGHKRRELARDPRKLLLRDLTS